MEVIHVRCAGLDISKKDAKVCVRIAGAGRRKTIETVTTWSSVTNQVLALREHLVDYSLPSSPMMPSKSTPRTSPRSTTTDSRGPQTRVRWPDAAVVELGLQRGEERFGHRVVPADPSQSHRPGDAVLGRERGDLRRGVLTRFNRWMPLSV